MEQPSLSFLNLGIAPKMLEILESMKFVTPTPIQHKAIPVVLEGNDIVAVAQTGTGKTLAFGIPTIQRLVSGSGRALVLVPTRELALQVHEVLKEILHSFGMKSACIIGGAPMRKQITDLEKNPSMIIATPGRLVDHMEQRNVDLGDVGIFVLDEADRMFDMGFAPQVNRVMRGLPKKRQTLLFSATMPEGIVNLAAKYMKLPIEVEIAPSGTAAEHVTQELFIVKEEAKNKLVQSLLRQYKGSVLIFARTKLRAMVVNRAVRDMGFKAVQIHSDRTMGQRKEAIEGFKSGLYRVLIATDIASRGIDVSGIELVINYDIPDDVENYVHRIGRTGRAGNTGMAITFATPAQGGDVVKIEKMIRKTLPRGSHTDVQTYDFLNKKTVGGGRRSFGPGRRR